LTYQVVADSLAQNHILTIEDNFKEGNMYVGNKSSHRECIRNLYDNQLHKLKNKKWVS